MKWTQDETIAFECACDTIWHLMAIYTRQIADETESANPDAALIEELSDARSKLHDERLNLRADNHAEIARIRKEYGAFIRQLREDRKCSLPIEVEGTEHD